MTRRLGSVSEPLAVGLGTLAVLGAYAWIARYGIDLVDEGYFLDLATRLQQGQLPYRDFDTYYTPGMLYLQAGTLAVLGQNVVTSRVLRLALPLAGGLLLSRGARIVPPRGFAAV